MWKKWSSKGKFLTQKIIYFFLIQRIKHQHLGKEKIFRANIYNRVNQEEEIAKTN